MKLPFLTNSKNLDQSISSSPPWPWPACANIKTLSFRASDPKDTNFSTFNSVFLDTQVTTPDSFFTFSSSCRSDSSVVSDDPSDPVESVIRSLRSDRLFFDPDQSCSLVSMGNEGGDQDKERRMTSGGDSNVLCTQSLPLSDEETRVTKDGVKIQEWGSEKVKYTQNLSLSRECRKKEKEIIEDDVKENEEVYRESEILSMESSNPYEDFKRSMEEMVEAHGLKEWQGLEELLDCYLKINGDENHGFIVGAFIDMLVSLSISSTTSTPMSSTSTSTSSSSSSSSSNVMSSSSSSLLSSISSPSSLVSLPPSSPCLYPIMDGDGGGGGGGDDESG